MEFLQKYKYSTKEFMVICADFSAMVGGTRMGFEAIEL